MPKLKNWFELISNTNVIHPTQWQADKYIMLLNEFISFTTHLQLLWSLAMLEGSFAFCLPLFHVPLHDACELQCISSHRVRLIRLQTLFPLRDLSSASGHIKAHVLCGLQGKNNNFNSEVDHSEIAQSHLGKVTANNSTKNNMVTL